MNYKRLQRKLVLRVGVLSGHRVSPEMAHEQGMYHICQK